MPGAEHKNTVPAWEFYDLKKDPKELHNAYNDSEYAPIISKMKKELLKLKKEAGDTDENFPVMKKIMDEYWDK